LSQDKFARLADVTHAIIIKIESGGMQNLIIDTIQKIAKALSIGLEDLTKSLWFLLNIFVKIAKKN
jgi:transcriptional regulator with XRE-family HTH domain